MKITASQLKPGKSLCDMHDGLSILESRIPGFVLLHHVRIRTVWADDFVRKLFETTLEDGLLYYNQIHNKILYYYEQDSSGLHKAVYHYDAEWFGIVTFKIG